MITRHNKVQSTLNTAHEEDLNSAVRIAALENRVELVDSFIALGASREYAALGAGEGNHDQLAQKLINEEVGVKESVVEGAALGNHAELVRQLLAMGASRNHAARGAAAGNHVDLLRELANDKDSKDFAIWGAALANHTPLVWTLIEEGASIDNAVWGAAAGDHRDLVKELMTEGASSSRAAQGAAAGGHIILLNSLVLDANSREAAVNGAVDGGYLNGSQERILRFVVSVKDAELKKLLIKKAGEVNKSIDVKWLSVCANKLSSMMEEYHFNFDQALAWQQKPELHEWFLLGINKVKDGTFPLEIFLKIASFALKLSDHDTTKLFEKHLEVMPQKLLNASLNHITKKFESKISCHPFAFFCRKKTDTKVQHEFEEKLAMERYQQRVSF